MPLQFIRKHSISGDWLHSTTHRGEHGIAMPSKTAGKQPLQKRQSEESVTTSSHHGSMHTTGSQREVVQGYRENRRNSVVHFQKVDFPQLLSMTPEHRRRANSWQGHPICKFSQNLAMYRPTNDRAKQWLIGWCNGFEMSGPLFDSWLGSTLCVPFIGFSRLQRLMKEGPPIESHFLWGIRVQAEVSLMMHSKKCWVVDSVG